MRSDGKLVAVRLVLGYIFSRTLLSALHSSFSLSVIRLFLACSAYLLILSGWASLFHLYQMRSLIPLTLLIAVFHTPVHAVVFPVHIQVNRNSSPSLSRRSPVPIGNIGNAQYVSNITLAGVQLPVLLDTGR